MLACVTRNVRVRFIYALVNKTEWQVADGPVNRCFVTPD